MAAGQTPEGFRVHRAHRRRRSRAGAELAAGLLAGRLAQVDGPRHSGGGRQGGDAAARPRDTGGANRTGAGERDGRWHRNRHRCHPLCCGAEGRDADRVDHPRRQGNRARRPAGVPASGRSFPGCRRHRAPGGVRRIDREGGCRTGRPGPGGGQGGGEARQRGAVVAAVHPAALFLRWRRGGADNAHHRLRRRREPGLHSRAGRALHRAAARPVARPACSLRGRGAGFVCRGRAGPHRAAARSGRGDQERATRGPDHAPARPVSSGRADPAALDPGVWRLDVVPTNGGLVRSPQADEGGVHVAPLRPRPPGRGGGLRGRSFGRGGLWHPQFLAEPSRAARHPRRDRRRGRNHALGLGARRPADGPAFLP